MTIKYFFSASSSSDCVDSTKSLHTKQTMPLNIESSFFSIGGNRHVNSSDWNSDHEVLAFGGGNLINLWKPLESPNIYTSLKGHTAEVTCVQFLYHGKYLVSAAADGQINVWKKDESQDSEGYPTYSLVQEFGDHHLKSVTTLSAATSASSSVFVSGSSDGHLSFWALDPKENEAPVSLVNDSDIDLRTLPLASAITTLPSTDPEKQDEYIISIGNTSRNTYIYVGSPSSSFKVAAKLEGQGDWVRSLAFSPIQKNGSILLASGCQDRYIRIWSITPGVDSEKVNAVNDGTEALTGELDHTYDESTGQLSNKVYELATTTPYSMKFDALIVGHDDWIYSLKWHPSADDLCLMSSSADSSIMIWTPDEMSGVWLSKTQLGDITIKGASTATGAYGGMWYSTWIGKNSDVIISLANTGAWKKWSLQKQDEGYQGMDVWNPEIGISGHTKSCTDIDWSPDGKYLLSTSLDKTTRLYAPWLTQQQENTSKLGWYEMARPQIHGYEMTSVRCLTPNLFVSAGDEKVLRVFQLTKSIATLLHNTVGVNLSQSTLQLASDSAAVPALGLSNKAVAESDEAELHDEEGNLIQETAGEEDKQIGTAPVDNVGIKTDQPPLEDQLQRLTLFPELEKIYGHGYEVTTMAVPHKGHGEHGDSEKYLQDSVVLSVCKANTLNHAVIRITDTQTWQRDFEPLSHHLLTVTSVEFSQDDKYVLSVSRDRTWALWQRDPETVPLPEQKVANVGEMRDENKGAKLFDLVQTNKKHSRIVWDCCWVHFSKPNDNYYFLTASRDKSIRLWSNVAKEGSSEAKEQKEGEWEMVQVLNLPAPVTAIAVTELKSSSSSTSSSSSPSTTHVLAAGLDTGDIFVIELVFDLTSNKFLAVTSSHKLDPALSPTARVNTLTWNPKPENLKKSVSDGEDRESAFLGIASEDHSVRVLKFC